MILYNSAVSGNCYKVRLLLAHLGLGAEIRELDVVDRSHDETADLASKAFELSQTLKISG